MDPRDGVDLPLEITLLIARGCDHNTRAAFASTCRFFYAELRVQLWRTVRFSMDDLVFHSRIGRPLREYVSPPQLADRFEQRHRNLLQYLVGTCSPYCTNCQRGVPLEQRAQTWQLEAVQEVIVDCIHYHPLLAMFDLDRSDLRDERALSWLCHLPNVCRLVVRGASALFTAGKLLQNDTMPSKSSKMEILCTWEHARLVPAELAGLERWFLPEKGSLTPLENSFLRDYVYLRHLYVLTLQGFRRCDVYPLLDCLGYMTGLRELSIATDSRDYRSQRAPATSGYDSEILALEMSNGVFSGRWALISLLDGLTDSGFLRSALPVSLRKLHLLDSHRLGLSMHQLSKAILPCQRLQDVEVDVGQENFSARTLEEVDRQRIALS